MIRETVNAFSVIVQILLVAIVIAGAYLGYVLIPDSFFWSGERIEPPAFVKIIAGGFVAWIAEVILLGPALVLLDIREAVRSIDAKTRIKP